MAEVGGGIVEGLGRASDLRCSHQTHGAITQVAILEQYENRQKQRQGRGQQRWNGFPGKFEEHEKRRLGILRDLNLQRPAVLLGIGYFLFYAAQRCCCLLPSSRRSQFEMQEPRLVAQICFVLRHFLEKLRYLMTRDGRAAEQGRQQHNDNGGYSERIGEAPTLEAPHQRREHESQEPGQRERDKDLLAGIEPGDEQSRDDHARGAVYDG